MIEDDPLDHEVGNYGREFAYYGEIDGLAPADVLSWGTSNAGQLLVDPPAKVGVLEPGALADLIVVDGDPLADLSLLARPNDALKAVIRDGALVIDRLPPQVLTRPLPELGTTQGRLRHRRRVGHRPGRRGGLRAARLRHRARRRERRTPAQARARARACWGSARFFRCDVTDDDTVRAAVGCAVADLRAARRRVQRGRHRRRARQARPPSAPMENWNRVIAVDLTGTWSCMRYELPGSSRRAAARS